MCEFWSSSLIPKKRRRATSAQTAEIFDRKECPSRHMSTQPGFIGELVICADLFPHHDQHDSDSDTIKIKFYLVSPPSLVSRKRNSGFKRYTRKDLHVIGA